MCVKVWGAMHLPLAALSLNKEKVSLYAHPRFLLRARYQVTYMCW